MDNLLRELSRRKVFRSLLLYAMAMWLVLQVVDVVAEPLLVAQWFQRALVFAAIIGFPFVAFLSWFFDLTKSGLVQDETTAEDSRRQIGYFSLLLLGVCIFSASVFISQRWVSDVNIVNIEPEIPSIAVLPFSQSESVTEPHIARLSDELKARLGSNARLRLVSQDALDVLPADSELKTQANQLGARYLLQGSISTAGEGVDLNVRLYDGQADEEVWTREFQNAQLYVVNELVVGELFAYLDIQQPGTALLTTNARAYELYLRGLQNLAVEPEADAALELFQLAITEDPRFPLPHARLCRYFVGQYQALSSVTDFEMAERYCFRALTLNADLVEVYNAMGNIYVASGQLEQARDSFNAALSINPEQFNARMGLARTYVSSDPILVESMLTDLMRLNPGSPLVYSAIQNLYFNMGRYEDAVEPARQAMRLSPNSETAKFNFTGVLILAGYFSDAKELLLEMLEQDSPRVGDIHSNLATVYFFEGQYAEAAELYEDAVSRESENPVLVRNLADATWHMSGKSEAQPLFELVLELGQRHLQINPDDTNVLSCMVVAYGSLGDQQQLESMLRRLLQLAAGNPQSHYDVAVAYSRLGNAELSLQHATMARDLGYPLALLQADPDLRGIGVSSSELI